MKTLAHNRFVGIDPGSRNFAVVALNGAGVVCHARMMRSTIISMKKTEDLQRVLFRKEIRRTIRALNPSRVMIEQFAVRGFGTQLTEVINLMIGCTMMCCDYEAVPCHTVMASTWKNAAKKVFCLDSIYEAAKKLGMERHVVDALCLALFARNDSTFRRGDARRIASNLLKCLAFMKKTSPSHIKTKTKRGGKGKKTNEVPRIRRRRRKLSVRQPKVLAKQHVSKGRVHRTRRRDT